MASVTEDDHLQSLNESEAMLHGDVNDDDIAAAAEMSFKEGEEEEVDTEFLKEYESTFNFIDSELDALRHSITDKEDTKVGTVDEISNSSVSDESFEMPAFDDFSLSTEGDVKEDEIEIERDVVLDLIVEKESLSEIKSKMQAMWEMETPVEAVVESPVEGPQQIPAEKLEQYQNKEPVSELAVQEEGTTDLQPQVKLEPSLKIQLKQVDTTKKSSQAFKFLSAIALAFLAGQRVPIQGSCPSPTCETVNMSAQRHPYDLETYYSQQNNKFEHRLFENEAEYCEAAEEVCFDLSSPLIEEMQPTEEDASNDLWCTREYDFSAILQDEIFNDSEEVTSTSALYETQETYVEAAKRLSSEDKATHAAVIHEALEEHSDSEDHIMSNVSCAIENEEFSHETFDFYFEDADCISGCGVAAEENFYQSIHADIAAEGTFQYQELIVADWDIHKTLYMMQNPSVRTINVVPQNLYDYFNHHFGVVNGYEGYYISIEWI